MTTGDLRRFLTLREAAEISGVSRDTLTKAIHAGKLKAKNSSPASGGKTLVRPVDLDAWFAGLPDA